jgi:hypothetical protein
MNNGKYCKEITDKICGLFESDSYTVKEICEICDITETTYYEWINTKVEFSESIKRAKEVYVSKRLKECEKSLNKLTEGYEYEEVTTEFKRIKLNDIETPIEIVKTVKKHIAPNLGAIIHYQTNKDPENWKNKQSTEISGELKTNAEPIKISIINTDQLPQSEDEVDVKI